jgi:dockerin type I repeat protein
MGGWPGVGNTNFDPQFSDPENGDYSLQEGSPCIDSGSPQYGTFAHPSVLAHGDFNGRVRIWDGDGDGQPVVDMGAFEFGTPPFVGDLDFDDGVDGLDLFVAQSQWQTITPSAPVLGDQNGDNRFDARDLLIVLHAWGREYE